ncbi:MAG: hypothetical protein WAK29_15735 [Terriglobales bacterium]
MTEECTGYSETEWQQMFDENTKHLELMPDCAGAWVRHAILIMMDDHPERHENLGLDAAERCILRALELNPDHLEALEEAAHFYDVMMPARDKATMYEEQYIQVAGRVAADMQAIVDDLN